MKSPIIIFAFNRIDILKQMIESLLDNKEVKDSDLFVFVDGARCKEEEKKVIIVQSYLKSISGFKHIEYFFAKENKGLGQSIIDGVSQIINKYGKAIILEDDLILSKNFLSFINQGLNRYKDEKNVFSICGYTNKIKLPPHYSYDAYFCTRSSSWGWGTWADRWNSVDWDLTDWNKYTTQAKSFNRWGGSDCWKMLNDWRNGKNESWAIRFCFTQFLQNKLSLFPIISKVQNFGFDGNGTNCRKYSRFKCLFDNSENKEIAFPSQIFLEPIIFKSAISYHSIWKRIYSRIRSILKETFYL